nr:hypothetical protein [Bacilli bacterium]
MYRTYRELYQVKTEITKIGTGAGALKIGKYLSVGLDIVGLGVIGAIFPGIFVAAILHAVYHPISRIVWMVAIGVMIGWAAKQFDPKGKSVLAYAGDVIAYLRRKRMSDGFKPVALLKNPSVPRFAFYAVDQGTAQATPITGKGAFTLLKPMGVRVMKDGTWLIKRSSHPLPVGKYRIVNGQVKPVSPMPILQQE